MLDISIQLFWAIRNRLARGVRLHHAPIPACALWVVHAGELHAWLELPDGERVQASVPAGQWLLMPPVTARTISASADASWTSVGLSALSHGRDLLPELAQPHPWQPDEPSAAHGTALVSALAARRAEQATDANALGDYELDALAGALFAWLWRERAARPFDSAARGDGPEWLWRARERALAEPSIAIARLARDSGYSDAAFRREWRRWTGLSPRDWLQNERLTIARGLLERTDQPIGEVAHRAGFDTAGQFTRIFKARTGLAPAAFRAMRREENY